MTPRLLKNKFKNLRISIRFSIYYALGSLLVLALALMLYARINQTERREYNARTVQQSAETVKSAVKAYLRTLNYNSRSLILDRDIQNVLNKEEISVLDAREVLVSNSSFWGMDIPHIESVYVFNMNDQYFGMDRHSFKSSSLSTIQEASWYDEVMDAKGSYVLKQKGDYFLSGSRQEKCVSFLRVINDLDTFLPIGILMINISSDAFSESYAELKENTDLEFWIRDENGETVVTNLDEPQSGQDESRGTERKNMSSDTVKVEETGWSITAAVPNSYTAVGSSSIGYYFAVIIVFIIVIFIFSYWLMYVAVSHPVEQMISSMDGESGTLKKMDFSVPQGEMDILKNTYNHMVDRNRRLIVQINEEQKQKRHAELRSLYEQIKPHFLYNTINAMQYLTLTGQNDTLYDALEMFGGFYRKTLSSGKEIINVQQEIEIVEDYMGLQRLRYGDKVECEIAVSEEAANVPILKLILQPLVENSIIHGIVPKIKSGTVKITAYCENDFLILSVEDDGVGMPPEVLERVKNFKNDTEQESFGLFGTLKRIYYYYGDCFFYEIESGCDKGTRITLKLGNIHRKE